MTTRRFIATLALLTVALLAAGSTATAATVDAFVGSPTLPDTTRTDTLAQAGFGFSANPSGTKQVDQLGVWVSPANPGGVLAVAHDVSLYNYSGANYTKIAGATVPAGSSADANGYAWASIPAVTLADTRQGADYYIATASVGTDVWAPNTGSANAPTLDATFGTRTPNGWFSTTAAPGVGGTAGFNGPVGNGGYYGPNIGLTAAAPLPNNLVGYWPLDGNATAVVGTSGTLVNGPTATTDRNGAAGGGLAFDGASSQYVSVAGGGGLNNADTATVSMWVQWNGTQDNGAGNRHGGVLGRQKNGQWSDNVLCIYNNGNPNSANINWETQLNQGVNSGVSPGDGTWRHVAVTVSPTIEKLYVDGTLEATRAAVGGFNNDATIPLTIGAWIGDGASYSTSRIDDVAVWNQVLTAPQVAALAAQTGTPLTLPAMEAITVDSNAADWMRSTTVLPYGGDSWTGLDAGDLPPAATYTQAVVTGAPGHIVTAANTLGVTAIERGIGDGIGFYRRTFNLPDFDAVSADIAMAVDNFGQVYINGIELASELSFSAANWGNPLPSFSIAADGTTGSIVKFEEVLANFSGWQAGENELVIVDKQRAGGGFAFRMDLLATPASGPVPALVQPLSVQASSELTGGHNRRAANAVDGAGQTTTNTNAWPGDTPPGMWLSGNGDTTPTITFDLGGLHDISSMTVYNYNEPGIFLNRGVQQANFSYSTDNITFTPGGTLSFDKATGNVSNPAQLKALGVQARYVRLDVLSNYGDGGYTGLNEVEFLAIPLERMPISGVTATATSRLKTGPFDRKALHLVDGTGLFADTHSAAPDPNMWLSESIGYAGGNDRDPEVVFDLGAVYDVQSVRIWNYNEANLLNRGVDEMEVLVSADGVTYSSTGLYNLAKAPGVGTVDFSEMFYLNAEGVRYVKFDILSNHNGVSYPVPAGLTPIDNAFVGLSEVRFYEGPPVPEPCTAVLAAMGMIAVALRARRRRRRPCSAWPSRESADTSRGEGR